MEGSPQYFALKHVTVQDFFISSKDSFYVKKKKVHSDE